jgi:hypothetical protein
MNREEESNSNSRDHRKCGALAAGARSGARFGGEERRGDEKKVIYLVGSIGLLLAEPLDLLLELPHLLLHVHGVPPVLRLSPLLSSLIFLGAEEKQSRSRKKQNRGEMKEQLKWLQPSRPWSVGRPIGR